MNIENDPPYTQRAGKFSNVFADYSINKTMPWIVLVGILSGVAFGLSLDAQNRVEKSELQVQAYANARAAAADATSKAANDRAMVAEREARMQQYYLIEVDAKLIKLGMQLPEGGYQRFKEKRETK